MTDKEMNEIIEDSKYIIECLDQQILKYLQEKEQERKEDEELNIDYSIQEITQKEELENKNFKKVLSKYGGSIISSIEDKFNFYIEELRNKIENLEEKRDAIIENLDNISCCNLDRVDIETGKEDNSMKDCVYNSDCITKK